MSRVSSARPTTWPPKPTVRNGQYSCHQPETRLLRKVHERLSWKFDRLATRKATVEKTWYQRRLKSEVPSPTTASSKCGPIRRSTTSVMRLTMTPEPPTTPKRAEQREVPPVAHVESAAPRCHASEATHPGASRGRSP